jgi:hypothetical protein
MRSFGVRSMRFGRHILGLLGTTMQHALSPVKTMYLLNVTTIAMMLGGRRWLPG